jgi:ADP-ribose pyrophosphatase YjhB (NUDIX family)
MTLNSAPEYIRYCPRCATPMIDRQVGDKIRRACPNCGHIHFTDPKVGVGVVVLANDRILLIKRAMHPNRGKWSLPAGYLDYGEDPQETAAREVLEETNLQVVINGLVDVYYNAQVLEQGGASIFILYRAQLVNGRLKAGDDADDAAFFGPGELPELAFDSTRDAVATWLHELRGKAGEN